MQSGLWRSRGPSVSAIIEVYVLVGPAQVLACCAQLMNSKTIVRLNLSNLMALIVLKSCYFARNLTCLLPWLILLLVIILFYILGLLLLVSLTTTILQLLFKYRFMSLKYLRLALG